jgi:cell division protein FtsZ
MDDLNFDIAEESTESTRIKVLGIGGAGSNAVARMIEAGIHGVEFHILNTDRQALDASPVPSKLAMGSKLTRGLGAGADPEIGRQAALEDTDAIIELIEGADMVFVTCGLGGGTGTGAAPVIAALARELNALTVAVVVKPFQFEGARRIKTAERGLADLASTVDTIITVSNEQLLATAPKGTSLLQAYHQADDVLRQAVQGISDIINTPGLINRDFADIRSIMSGMGHAVMGTGMAEGEGAAVKAAQAALAGALMEQRTIEGAAGLLIHITGSAHLGLHDVNEACALIASAANNDEVRVNFGVVIDESLGAKVKVTLIATGFQRGEVARPRPAREREPAVIREEPESEPAFVLAPTEPPPAVEVPDDPQEFPFEVPAVTAESEPEPVTDPNDLDTPAFLRRDRRLFQ